MERFPVAVSGLPRRMLVWNHFRICPVVTLRGKRQGEVIWANICIAIKQLKVLHTIENKCIFRNVRFKKIVKIYQVKL